MTSPRARLWLGIVITLAVVAGIVTGIRMVGGSGEKTAQHARTRGQTVPGWPDWLSKPNPPPLANTGEDFTAVFHSIQRYRIWLFHHPRPELLSNIERDPCDCYSQDKAGLSQIAAHQVRFDPASPDGGPPFVGQDDQVLDVQVYSRAAPNAVELLVHLRPGVAYRAYDQSGKLLIDSPAQPFAQGVIYTLVHDYNDPHWYIVRGRPGP